MWIALREIAQLIRVLFTSTKDFVTEREKQNEKATRITDADNTVDRMRHYNDSDTDTDGNK